MAKVRASRGGSGSINLHAQVPQSGASSSVNVHVTSGSAYGKVTAQEPSSKRMKSTPSKFQEFLMLPPSGPSNM